MRRKKTNTLIAGRTEERVIEDLDAKHARIRRAQKKQKHPSESDYKQRRRALKRSLTSVAPTPPVTAKRKKKKGPAQPGPRPMIVKPLTEEQRRTHIANLQALLRECYGKAN